MVTYMETAPTTITKALNLILANLTIISRTITELAELTIA